MREKKLFLASDNWSPAHPLVVKAIEEANIGYAPAYGKDPWTQEATELIQEAFKRHCQVFMVPTGTGANVLALKLCCRPHESIICSDVAHIHLQETGALEAVTGLKVLCAGHINGKVTPNLVLKKINNERAFGKHSTLPRVLSIAQASEFGTVYDLSELKALAQLCAAEHILLHIDGSRLYNAAVTLGASLPEIIDAAQPDILSLGGTKNGLVGAEAVVIFNELLFPGSEFMHKQTLQLFSKMRFISAQYIPFFKHELWHSLALQANKKAQQIAEIIQKTPGFSLNYPVESNQLFFSAPAQWIAIIQEKTSAILWDADKCELRFIASWTTTDDDIQELQNFFSSLK